MDLQLEHGFRAVDHEPRMHLDGDFDAVIGGELRLPDPIGRHHLLPLPLEDLEVIRRPRAGHPIGPFRLRGIARTAAEIHHHRHAQLLRQPDGFAAHLLVVFGVRPIRMQRIPVAAQCADGEPLIVELLFEFVELRPVIEHGELAVRIARIVPGARVPRYRYGGLFSFLRTLSRDNCASNAVKRRLSQVRSFETGMVAFQEYHRRDAETQRRK